ncbi:MAG: aldehyde reductase [Propionibacteriaceae bacterium]|jgi:nucleoside-diphosphate-sugar epimerase|nr:aldehyde reductase [Propionibacteriaceae bacterium]
MAAGRQLVLVTGGSGYIGVNIIIKLLEQGYRVRTTLRTMSRQDEVRQMLVRGGVADPERLEFVEADLTDDANWDQAAMGAAYVIHVASPTPVTRPRDGEAMVAMAVDGVRRVMAAAVKAHAKRVVLTSASGAVIAGHKEHPDLFTEEDWTDLSANIDAYQRSKTMAEKAAWEMAADTGIQLATVNPVAVMGPILGPDFSHSNRSITAMLSGGMPWLLRIGFDYVDVRDVADLHLAAMTNPDAAGERFIATSGENLTYRQVAMILKERLGYSARRVSTTEIPDWLVRLFAAVNPALRMPASFLGQNTACSGDKARRILGWSPRPAEEAIVATATSLIKLGIVKR